MFQGLLVLPIRICFFGIVFNHAAGRTMKRSRVYGLVAVIAIVTVIAVSSDLYLSSLQRPTTACIRLPWKLEPSWNAKSQH
jgi:multisubunit Na+/H+ antiporter MnhB subunit